MRLFFVIITKNTALFNIKNNPNDILWSVFS